LNIFHAGKKLVKAKTRIKAYYLKYYYLPCHPDRFSQEYFSELLQLCFQNYVIKTILKFIFNQHKLRGLRNV